MAALIESIDDITESIDLQFGKVARSLQQALRTASWLPDCFKLSPSPVSCIAPFSKRPTSLLTVSRTWISRNRALSATFLALVSVSVFLVRSKRCHERPKRRAKRARNGTRVEVVVLAGPPYSKLTRAIALDLERRGFIIYIPVSSIAQEQIVMAYSKSNIRSLNIDVTSSSKDEVIRKFSSHISAAGVPQVGSSPTALGLTAFIQLPSSSFSRASVSELSPAVWSEVLNTQLLLPFATVGLFLPLLIAQRATVLFLVPSITAASTPTHRATESVVSGGLQQYISSLRTETYSQGLNVTEMRLGPSDLDSLNGEWHQEVQAYKYSRAELTKQHLPEKSRRTALRHLHHCIFDAIERRWDGRGIIFVGRGSATYNLVGRLIPDRFLSFVAD